MGRNEAREEPGRGPVLDLSAYVPGLLTHLANKLGRSATALYRRRFGVAVTEWRILALLAREAGVPASRICQVIGLDKAPVSRSLAGLEARGLVAIHPDAEDGRRRAVDLTPAGRALHDRLIVAALEREDRLLACLDDGERATLIALLNRLHDNLGAIDAAEKKPRRAHARGPGAKPAEKALRSKAGSPA